MAGIDVGGGPRRSLNSDINMIPFIDLLMVTISFLLITAVWVTHSRIEASAQVPGHEGPVEGQIEPQLHVYVGPKTFTLAWKQERTIIRETVIDRRDGTQQHPELQDAIVKQFEQHGQHTDPADPGFDHAILHTPDAMPFGDMVGVMDAVYAAKREVRRDGNRRMVPAFQVALAQ